MPVMSKFTVGPGAISELTSILETRRSKQKPHVVFFVDCFFKNFSITELENAIQPEDLVYFVDTKIEPTTMIVNEYIAQIRDENVNVAAVVGFGGGCTMDTAKAVSILIHNSGLAEHYQGWDLVKKPAAFKIGIPTIFGTGAEATRTCVMTNKENGLKLGMNSDYTVFDQIILDPNLSKTVPRNQYFWTGMDAYIHCIESLSGNYRNAIGDSFSQQVVNLCREIFLDGDMTSSDAREKLMVASYLGGSAIATSYVGLVHPLSAGLSVVLGYHHCVANCIVMRAMEEYYPDAYREFWHMVEKQGASIPKDVCRILKMSNLMRCMMPR